MATRKYYHCDGYYLEGACWKRGSVDEADIRYRKGRQIFSRNFCENKGKIPDTKKPCLHCVENKKRHYTKRHRAILIKVTA